MPIPSPKKQTLVQAPARLLLFWGPQCSLARPARQGCLSCHRLIFLHLLSSRSSLSVRTATPTLAHTYIASRYIRHFSADRRDQSRGARSRTSGLPGGRRGVGRIRPGTITIYITFICTPSNPILCLISASSLQAWIPEPNIAYTLLRPFFPHFFIFIFSFYYYFLPFILVLDRSNGIRLHGDGHGTARDPQQSAYLESPVVPQEGAHGCV